MKNEIKDLFTNEGEELGISAEEIVLAPDEEIYAEAAQIAAASAQDVKYPFVIKYDVNWKEFLLDMIDKCGGVVKEEIGDTELAVSVNMAQLKFIKALDCVEGVRVESIAESLKFESDSTDFEENFVLTTEAENGIITREVQMSDVTEASVASTNTATPRCTTESCCCEGSTMETAIPLTVEQLTSVQICCPGSEVWYKFDIEKDRDYTIYSSGGTATGGHLDTIGTLYDADGNQLAYCDDHNGMLYFKICEYLYEGYTYYLKVQVDNNKTGNFYIKVTRDVLVESVSISTSSVTMAQDQNYQLEADIFPMDATEKRIKWVSLNKNVATVNLETGVVTAVDVGEATIRAYDWYERALMVECVVTVLTPTDSVVKPTKKAMAIDSYTTLESTNYPSGVNVSNIVWRSKDENIVTVDPYSGYVLAKGVGATSVCVESRDGSIVYGLCNITVNGLSDIATDSWEAMGFVYDNSQRDFNRANQGLPPYSYEQWILNGRQKLLYVVDQNGSAGIIGAGHARLLIRSSEGLWYRTEFVKNPSVGRVIVECFQIPEEEKNNRITGNGIQYICLCGEYTQCLAEAERIASNPNNGYNGEYDLITNNCMHYVNEILGYSDNVIDAIDNYIHSNNCFVPQTYYNNLLDILNS